jgi:hypothetical protein
MIMKKDYDCHLGPFDYEHKNPPAPFNPDYNPDYVRRCKEYEIRVHKFMNDDSFDNLSDDDYDKLLNAFCEKFKRELKIYNHAE